MSKSTTAESAADPTVTDKRVPLAAVELIRSASVPSVAVATAGMASTLYGGQFELWLDTDLGVVEARLPDTEETTALMAAHGVAHRQVWLYPMSACLAMAVDMDRLSGKGADK